MKKSNKLGQITVFVIIALVLVGGIAGYFVLRDRIGITKIPTEFQPVYDYYLSCIEAETEDGVSLIGTQAGYAELPEFEPGSEYAPFSSQLDFLGFGVPYWYYISQNGLVKEQIPTLREVEQGLGDYLEEELEECDFTEFRRQGYEISLGEAKVSSDIKEQKINVNVQQSLSISTGEGDDKTSVVLSNHNIESNSKLGKLYNVARDIYEKQSEEMILENYAFDILNLYAPVTGTEISCSPLIWSPYEVIEDLEKGLNANIQMLKMDGEYYDSSEIEDYYIIENNLDLKDEQVNFMYQTDWPSRFEVWPTDGNMMISESVGPEQGLGVAGFCYVSYKYVYDLYFPVLIQVTSLDNPEEIFQFPVAVVVSKNQPREAINVEPLIEDDGLNVCDNSNVDVSIYTYNNYLEPIEANVSYQCFSDVCYLGQTINENGEARLDVKVPACSNGIISADSEGYKETDYTFSTNQDTIADVILEKEHNLELEIYVDGKLTRDMAVLNIKENSEQEKPLQTVPYPYNSNLELSEGDYIFDVKVFTNKQISIPESNKETCVEVPKSGVLGIFGLKEDKCYDYVVPAQTMSSVLYAGGDQNYYVAQSELNGASKLRVYVESVDIPTKIEDIQKSYELIDIKGLDISIV